LKVADSGAVQDRYMWGPAVDQLLSQEDGSGNVLWALGDNQNTIRDWVNFSAGTVADHVSYDAYGNNKVDSASVDAVFGWTGRYRDPTTGLQYNHNRWYDPSVGRWMSEDPIGFFGGQANLSAYVGNSPTNWSDPSGLEPPWWAGTKAFFNTLFVDEIYGGGKALVTGQAGAALGDRAVGMVENQTGRPFTGSASDYARFGRGIAGDLSGVNGVVEGVSGYDISNLEGLDPWQRGQRGALGVGALAGNAAGGLSAAAKFPKTFPMAARAATNPLKICPPVIPPSSNVVSGFRAVSTEEAAAISRTGKFGPAPSGSEVKYFFETEQQAIDFGSRMYGKGNYRVVQGDFPDSAIGARIHPATEGPAFVIPNDNLPLGTPSPPYAPH